MATFTLIISVDDFKAYTGISDSFDSNFLAPIIERATDINCQAILGTALTDKLITDYNAGTLAGAYQELYDSSKSSVLKMIVWQAYIYGLPRFAFKIQNSGISRSGGDLDAEAIGNAELAILQREAEAAKVLYENRVKTYLSNNAASLPELQVTTPEFLQENTTKSKSDYGISDTPTKLYSNF